MRSEQEIKELAAELSKLTGFIAESGDRNELDKKDWAFSCNVGDALSWVVEEITTEHFTSDAYLNLEVLRQIAFKIEVQSGKKLEDYKL